MKRKWIVILVLLIVVVALGFYISNRMRKQAIVQVQTGRVLRQDITRIVTASGEIKPRNYINIGANAQGQIVEILVTEGARVKKGQLLARLENVQPEADLEAQQAAVSTAEADSRASEAGLKAADETLGTLEATIDRSRSDLERAQQDHDRYKGLFEEKLVARQEFEAKQAALKSAMAALREAQTRLAQSKAQREQAAAQLSSSQRRVVQARASVARFSDILKKHNAYAPLDGVVTNLPVRVGETVVTGIQNSQGSTLMTIADMSLITSEVKVDEADIVNILLDQSAVITIDAIPDQTFTGRVIEIGNSAIVRSTGVAASQSTLSSHEAKDFKVVVAIDNPPDVFRPGLSCTAKITTATRRATLSVPVQSVTVRDRDELDAPPSGAVQAATQPNPSEQRKNRERIQGVFVISGGAASFRKVKTGISGSTDIEVLDGLRENDEVLTGPYQVIRTLRNGAPVKVEIPSQRKK